MKLTPTNNGGTTMTPLAKATEITKDRLRQWRLRNEREGVPCTPVVLINAMHGEKSGIILNIVQDVPVNDILLILEMAVAQVKKKIEESN
jgi:hypothetical protein